MHSIAQPGHVLLGKYRVEHVLGEGGMGIVLAARHLDLGELFAIKLMLPAALADREAVARFLREARAAARLKSEHVARVHDVGRLEDGAPYMVMEHLSGRDLQQVLRARGPLPPQEAALHIYQACEAVAEAHSLGIVHRDLKSSNLFLTQRLNGSSCVKVLDFGISKELEPAQKLGPDLTKTGTFMGSPKYMSPEQMAHIKETDARSDIWSLGVILFELLTGKCPFVAESLMELISRVATMPPPPPTELRPDLPTGLDKVVLKCLEKPREQRFQSVAELMAALRPFVTDERVSMTTAATPTTAVVQKSAEGQTEPGNQTTKAWARPSLTVRGRGSAGLVVGIGVAITSALLVGGGAWFTVGRGSQGASVSAAVASGEPMGVTAPSASVAAVPEVAHTGAVVAPAITAQEMDSGKSVGALAASVAAPLTSASASNRPEAGAAKKTSPRSGGATQQATTAAPKRSAAVPKIPGFDD